MPTRFKFQAFVVLLFGSMLISACSDPAPENSDAATVRYVKLAAVRDVPALDEFSFPAVVSPVKTVDVSFEVSGRLVQTDLVTGSDVKKGHLLATIDQQPFKRRVEEQQTRRDQAERELTRIEKMYDKDLVSQSMLDTAKTSFELADIDLKNAQQDLSYTQLYAPFDAKISQRLVENNSFVTAGTPIARLQDVSKIYFNINVPERLLTANIGRGIDHAEAALLTAQDTWFPVHYVEHSTQPDPVSQTYEAVFAMQPPKNVEIPPGARAVVRIGMGGTPYPDGRVVTVKALVGSKDDGFYVWHYDADTHAVTKVAVQVAHFEDEFAVISGSLATGDQVVAAGATQVTASMTVRPYKPEQ
ncbi:efflux RND transporter periplasmic adaptor subunit [Alteromonas halophila]|uniref:Hemolysin secretion protein D n=1 Tax=Alteromonas halophila TaxID=516698 RepID=A0A918JD36_9ALTE|nr:efflux RND transporter periplasmic adaptor subunit [Alteromonas halophila]GGW74995.1 hemolysin secretion protein D [Alteromonas halophila]